jgi:hypothetical protein
MKRPFAGLWALTLAALVLLAIPLHAQTAARTADSPRPFSYNISDEVTLKGTVSSVLTKPSKGMIMGSHLLLQTSSGTVDASLGMFGLRGKGAVQAKAGDQIEITGIMKTIKGQQVFLSRTVKAGNQLYTVRNEHGFPVSPQARERATHKPATKGEAL